MVTTNLNLTVAGELVTIRPIRVTDAAMEADFVRKLSPQTKHYRFFGGVRELSPAQVKLFCEVDGRHSMAFVATVQKNGCETEIGVGRYAPNSKADIREMAVTIADEWQHKGLGKLLVKQLIASASDYGVKQLYSVELTDNAAMRDLAHELGMSTACDPDDAHQVIYSLAV
jgi:GNAT superfamily N-acetyltransferase